MTGHGLEADHVQKGASVYAGRIGERVAAPDLDAFDDGRLPGEWGTDGIDDEGTPTQRTAVIQEGRVTSYLYDLVRARKDGVDSTGNGRRESFRHLPIPRMTNTYIAPGEASPEELISGVERGFYAVSFAGGQVDPTTGDFVFGVSEGYLIEGGKVTKPCRGATLIGNCLEALGRIDAVASDFEMKTGFCGKGGQRVPVGTGQGHVRIGELTVGGTAVWITPRATSSRRSPGARSRRRWRPAPATPRPTSRTPWARDPRLRRRGGEPDRGGGARGGGALLDRPPGGLRVRDRAERRGARRGRPRRRRGGADRRRRRVRGRAVTRRRRPARGDPGPPRPRRRRVEHRAQDRPRQANRAGGPRGRRARGRGGDGGLRRRGAAGRDRLLHGPRRRLRGDHRLRVPPGDRRGERRRADGPRASAWAARPRASTPTRSAARRPSAPRRCSAPESRARADLPRRPRPDRRRQLRRLHRRHPVRRRGAARPLPVRRAAWATRSPRRPSRSPTTPPTRWASTPPHSTPRAPPAAKRR